MTAFLRPSSLAEAIELLQREPQARPLAGGTAIQILRRQGVLQLDPPLLVDLMGIDELRGIERVDDGALRIGAMATQRQVERSPLVPPLLAETYRHVGNVRVRNTATVGGNLAHGDYRLDPPAALLALSADVRLVGPGGTRWLPLREFFVDLLETALQPAELLAEVRVPPDQHAAWSFRRFSSLAENDWPCLAVAVVLDREAGRARLGVSGMAATPLLVELPISADLEEGAIESVLAVVDPVADVRGSAAYKRRVCAAVVREAIQEAMSR